MANNFGSAQGNSRGQGFGDYFDNQHPYQADQNSGPYYDNSNINNQRGGGFPPRGGRGSGNDNGGRGGDRSNKNEQRGRSQRGNINKNRDGSFGEPSNQRGNRGARGNFEPLPAKVNWPQQLEFDRQQASLNWAPSFRNASIPIPPQFFSHTKDEQLVMGQELMDLAVLASESAVEGFQQPPMVAAPAQLDAEALELEANSIAGD